MSGERQQLARRRVLQTTAVATGLGVLSTRGTATAADSKLCVDPSASDCYDSIQAAIDDVAAGGTVDVAAATYNESLVVDKPLTLTGDSGNDSHGPGAAAPELNGNTRNENAIAVRTRKDSVTIEGFEIRDYGDESRKSTANGIWAPQPTKGLTIRDNLVTNIGWNAIVAHPGEQDVNQNLTIARNIVGNFATSGITVRQTKSGVIRNNQVNGSAGHKTGNVSKEYPDAGIQVNAKRTRTTNRIETADVTITENEVNGPIAIECIGVYAWNANNESEPVVARNIEVANNTVSAGTQKRPLLGVNLNPWYGARLSGVTVRDNELDGNLINIGSNGRGSATDIAENLTIANNTVQNGIIGVAFVDLDEGKITIRENDIRKHSRYGVRTRGRLPDDVTFHRNNIVGNTDYGMLNKGEIEIDAEQNWWGAKNGPEREAGKSGRTVGDGDAVSGPIDYTPWSNNEISTQ